MPASMAVLAPMTMDSCALVRPARHIVGLDGQRFRTTGSTWSGAVKLPAPASIRQAAETPTEPGSLPPGGCCVAGE